MIIFIGDLLTQGFTAEELKSNGAYTARWRQVEEAHLNRIRNTLSVVPLGARN